MEETKETSTTIGTKRSRNEESATASEEVVTLSKVSGEGDVVIQEADEKPKKPRQEKPAKINEHRDDDDHAGSNPVDDVDAEAVLMRALEEAIEKDMTEAKKGAIPTVIDEDEDYDESD